MINLLEKYKKEVVPLMIKNFGYKNVMNVPLIDRVVVNTSFGKILAGKSGEESRKIQESILDNLSLITSQKPQIKRSKKSISGFKLRKGMVVGASVTLRGNRMYDFLDRLINIGLPRSRDFQGINEKSFDKKGNLTIGIKEQISFPEVMPEKARVLFGFEVTVVVKKAKKREDSIEFLRLMGFPIKKKNNK
jgi:large subunit ribosomal protein L5